ncbi:RecA homologous recombination, DNA repair protein [Histoplasma capsulatum var. duboisii H88]|uniref:DNA repair protein RAD51 homolog 3 n=1 Tax=Ajellomyces capsulatus (strain H88) TaxID=544711 RepID=A0A8A1LC93_AJEC8|nr:RecA homologous recombination, DNA repair protein [Histoplasma capsulatum var. duboisii H88]
MTTQEEDIAKFSSPDEAYQKRDLESPFRAFGGVKLSPLPTHEGGGAVSTGLPRLDVALALRSGPMPSPLGPRRKNYYGQSHPDASTGGIKRGEITEVIGPRGVGKTAFAMGIAASVLQAAQKVVWIDTAGPMNPTRFKGILQRDQHSRSSDDSFDPASGGNKIDEFLNQLLYFHPPTIAHLLALISHSPKGFPPPEAGLIVIDSISSLFTSEYRTRLPPGNRKAKFMATAESKNERTRWKIIGNLAMNLKKLAVRLNCVVVVINEMASRFRGKHPPVLHEALSGMTWDSGVATRIMLCWHWLPPSSQSRVRMKRVRFAEVVKAEKVVHLQGRSQRIVPFVIKKTGLHEFSPRPCGTPLSISTRIPNRPHLIHARAKRKLGDAIGGSPDTSRKPRIEHGATPGVKIENIDQEEGNGGETPSDASLILSIKEEDEEEGYEYEWLDEDGIEFADETVDGEEAGSDDHTGRDGDDTSESGPRFSRTMGGALEDDTVLLLQNISDDDEFD